MKAIEIIFILLCVIICYFLFTFKNKKNKILFEMVLLLLVISGGIYKWIEYQHELIQYPSNEIRNAYSLKFEYKKETDNSFIYMPDEEVDRWNSFRNILSTLSYIPTNEQYEEEWLYRITCNEGHDGNEVEMLIGDNSIKINGIWYIYDDSQDTNDRFDANYYHRQLLYEILPYWYKYEEFNEFRIKY